MSEVLTAVNDAFKALFFGDGAWLGILLFLSIMVALLLKWKYTSPLVLVVAVFLGIEYMSQDMLFHALMMLFTAAFTLIYAAKTLRR